jgi:hypothetical protein
VSTAERQINKWQREIPDDFLFVGRATFPQQLNKRANLVLECWVGEQIHRDPVWALNQVV